MREDFESQAKRKTGRPLKYRVTLSHSDHQKLAEVLKTPKNGFQKWRAKLLLALDEGKLSEGKRMIYEDIARVNGVSLATVFKTARKFTNSGLSAVLEAPVTGKRFSAEEDEALKVLINHYNRDGVAWSLNQLAKEFGRSRSAITRATKRLVAEGEIEAPGNDLT